ncbi:HAD-IIB family hydrolase [Methylophaga sp.]|uniref:HAD-IIB family hydrolase n=1 Tax=Methylophaga sp. TaxID=2024840 RepID=UPI003F6A0E2A
MLDIDISAFLIQHQLPQAYLTQAERWFTGLAEDILLHHKGAKKPIIVGINGAQGSGKSTLAAFLVFILQRQFHLNAVSLSLDDFYYTRHERQSLAKKVHPLLSTRGVPGTHDIALANKTITDLLHSHRPVSIPRFNKAIDDRFPENSTPKIKAPVDIIILEGWCLGSEAQKESDLVNPLNDLEFQEDTNCSWRRYVNEQLATVYPALFERIDFWVMLKAPSFNAVFEWRLEQETKLSKTLDTSEQSHLMDKQALSRFIKFYQRITENTLKTLPAKVHYLYELNQHREIIKLTSNTPILNAMKSRDWLVFTDMDGSLLDHHDYHFDEAVPTLEILEKENIPVIPVTSKTQAEVELLRDSLNNGHPFIVENGAAVFIPIGYFAYQPEGTIERDAFWVKEFCEPRKQWQSLIEEVRSQYQDQFKTFADAGIDGIIAMTGLNVHAAARAARRQYGEPVSWHGNGNRKQQFIDELKRHGAQILEGGRFIHVSGQCDKGQAIEWLTNVYKSNAYAHQLKTLAIGDSQNDLAMLEKADYALIIRSPVHAVPVVERKHNLYISTHTGPKGWAEGVNKIIDATMHSDSSNLPRGNHG